MVNKRMILELLIKRSHKKFVIFFSIILMFSVCSGEGNNNESGTKNQDTPGWRFGIAMSASQFDLHGSDYFTNGFGLVLERKFGNGKNFSVSLIELQNVKLYPKAYSKDGIVYRRYYLKSDIFTVTFKKTWQHIGAKIGFLYAIPLPVVGFYFGDLDSFYMSIETFDNLILGEYYFETSPVTIGFHFRARDNFPHFFIGAAGFESEAGAIIKYDTMISSRLIFRTLEAYHFRKKVFGIMLGLGLRL